MRYYNKDQHNEDTDDLLYDAAVDETGTIDTTSLIDSDADTLEEKQKKQKQQQIHWKGWKWKLRKWWKWQACQKKYWRCMGLPQGRSLKESQD